VSGGNGKGRLFRHEIEAQIALLKRRIAEIKSKAENCKRNLAPDVADAVAWLKSESETLSKSKNPDSRKKAKKFIADAKERESNPKNYVLGNLLPSAAAEVANLTRKKETLDEQLLALGSD
jgi:hypothetical protein